MNIQINNDKLIQHLEKKWGKKNCPMCNVFNWSVTDKIFELREFHGGGLIVGNIPITPVIPIICTNCGNTVFINAITAGMLEPPEEKKKDAK